MWSESVFVTVGGLALGAVIATGISDMLVMVLTGVFDPPPDVLSVPWVYLAAVTALTCGSVAAADAARPTPAGDRGAARPVSVIATSSGRATVGRA